jgi:serine/threonine-protein kinase SRPK3
MLYNPNLEFDYLKDLAQTQFYPDEQELVMREYDADIGNDTDFEPLTTTFPDLDKVGILADEFDRNSSYSEDEGIEDYKKGGYHPVFVGEILNGRYVILQKLGWGHFSTVWLSRDIKFNTFVAIKVQKSASHYLEAAFDEVEILQKAVTQANNPEFIKDLKEFYKGEKSEFGVDDCHVVQLLNAFIYQGPYGRHFCMVFEILGVNLLEIIKRYEYKGIPLPICRRMSKQILIGLHYLHKYCGIIHTDLKPENVMVCLDQTELKEIYESGQLNTKKKIQRRLNKIQRKIRLLNENAVDHEPDVNSENDEATSPEPQFHPDELADDHIPEEPEHQDDGVTRTTQEPEDQNVHKLLTDDDLEREYQRMISEKGLANKKDKKNLRKRLKQKLKKNQEKAEKTKLMANDPKGSLRVNMIPPKQSAISKKIKIDHPLFYKSGLSQDFKIKIADLGNGCWTHHHFQPEIQTRQYRSPEVILGINYNETADTWSFACMLFEMITGEFLFDPRKNANWSKSMDHLALMMEMLNKFPRNYSTIGTHSKKYVDNYGNLRKIANLNFVTMKDLLIQKYKALPTEAQRLEQFLLPMLYIYPQNRMFAFEALHQAWLNDTSKEIFEDPERLNIPEFPNHTPLERIDPKFEVVVDEEEFDADKSNASIDLDDEDAEDAGGIPDYYEKECKYFDRSFRNVYVGYADGIDLNALDNTANWQFDHRVK